jgi:hypothetical protein
LRNNVIMRSRDDSIVGEGCTYSNDDILVVNNTTYQPNNEDNQSIVEGSGTNWVARNNLGYGNPNSAGSYKCVRSVSTASNNWCYSTNTAWCRDPVDGSEGSAGDCFNPSFVSTTYGNPDFMRPGTGTRGIDTGYQTVPVWNDYHNAARSTIDVGAVER